MTPGMIPRASASGWDGERPTVGIAGAGIAGLTLALTLHERGIRSVVWEAAPALRALGVGINILPHASRVLHRLGLGPELDATAVTTTTAAFYNRFGQHVYSEPLGRFAGHGFPQYSVHRGDLHEILLAAVVDRLGAGAVVLDRTCQYVESTSAGVTAVFADSAGGRHQLTVPGFVGADGVHSAVRNQLHRSDIQVRYSGYNMWRGVTVMEPFLDGSTMARVGWLETGKLVVYPIRHDVDADGRQLVNWVAEVQAPQGSGRDWNRRGRLEDFLPVFEHWDLPWLDVPAMLRGSESILEYPMVDQDPLERWGEGPITLIGDAAHPMLPRGSNGAGQAILDADFLAASLDGAPDVAEGFQRYEAERVSATKRVVLANRTVPPDTVLKLVHDRTGDQPFRDVDEVVSRTELQDLTRRYREIAAYADV